ncbi:predicted protein [Sclerotinia sclerotiorum 1980 UF-70]|uniref:Uncharacterized protein n=1 Tax=Sclerotinia sclerotiorum (strain ATCC 18683 / 1980 / Ss-1) TaxID=665079 RepID=A7E8R0_SCLS1|nr:predicted protein [Sclerotinia sclerotiorum 1980 UF-70]EDN96762.1 predicted protein [Sclerotinia sclerotiorum 1980 UF-70]
MVAFLPFTHAAAAGSRSVKPFAGSETRKYPCDRLLSKQPSWLR